VSADVSLGPDPAGGLRIDGITLNVDARVDGLDAQQVREIVDQAKATCPVSKALAGVDIALGEVTV
jgi:osmotically inducible protein OsmC